MTYLNDDILPSSDDFETDDFEEFDGSSDVSDDDILPSFGPQLSLAEDDEPNEDVVDFAHLNKEYYNKNVSHSLTHHIAT